jgi:glycine/sarcosine N-methyltransferase
MAASGVEYDPGGVSMPQPVVQFYDNLAANYHLMFEDWEASIARQAAALAPIIERECGPPAAVRILDCACGIGTQSLGLAKFGFRITGCDLSTGAVARARVESAKRGLNIPFAAADMRDLSVIVESGFDAVVCLDNALPHLDSDEDLRQAASEIRRKLRPGGVLLAGIRDYDRLVIERPAVQGPAMFTDGGRRRIVFQLWDWIDDRRYVFHIYITLQIDDGWQSHHYASTYRAVLRDELTGILGRAGFTDVRWLQPAESRFYQPIVLARAC